MRTAAETLGIVRKRSMSLRLGMRPGSLIFASFDDVVPSVLLHQQHFPRVGRLLATCLTLDAGIERVDTSEAAMACLLYDPGA